MTVKVELLFWKLKIVCKFFKRSKGFVSFLRRVVWKRILLVVLSRRCALLVLDVFLPSKCHSGLNALNILERKTHLCDVGSVYHIGGYFKPLLLSMSNLLYYFFFWNVRMRSFFLYEFCKYIKWAWFLYSRLFLYIFL